MNDQQLQLALAKMLPDRVHTCGKGFRWWGMTPDWRNNEIIHDTEWLHVCHLVEQTLNGTTQVPQYEKLIDYNVHAT